MQNHFLVVRHLTHAAGSRITQYLIRRDSRERGMEGGRKGGKEGGWEEGGREGRKEGGRREKGWRWWGKEEENSLTPSHTCTHTLA